MAVLREALTRDELARQRRWRAVRKGQVAESVKAFIQNVHHFRDERVRSRRPPAEHVAIFDEAQRAWTRDDRELHEAKEGTCRLRPLRARVPDLLHGSRNDWAVVVCLVGGGQEINTGEAGIDAWLEAVREHFPTGGCTSLRRLTDSEYAAGRALDAVRGTSRRTSFDDCLHLSVSMRSFRAENVSAFVKALLDRDRRAATRVQHESWSVTRSSSRGTWTPRRNGYEQRARGSERYGLVASSKAQRLKPHAIDVRVEVDPVHWFLNDKDDTRSSYYLEDAARSFRCRGWSSTGLA